MTCLVKGSHSATGYLILPYRYTCVSVCSHVAFMSSESRRVVWLPV